MPKHFKDVDSLYIRNYNRHIPNKSPDMKLLTQLYTANRALQILVSFGIKVLKVMQVKILQCCIWVKYRTKNGVCSLFVSVRAFLKLAIAARKERASEYVVTQRRKDRQWDVVNGRDITQSGYTVITTPDLVTCNCDDFKGMGEYLPEHEYLWQICQQRRACKHIFSTLSALGCGSLREYFQAWQPGGRFNLA